MATAKTTTAATSTCSASPYAGYPYPYTRDHSDPKGELPGVPHRPKIVAEGIPLTWPRCVAYITGQTELRRRRKWYGAHQKDIDGIINNEPPPPVEAKQWSKQCMNALRFYRRCCWTDNTYPIETVHVDCLWYKRYVGKGKGIMVEVKEGEQREKVIPNYTLKCHRCSDHGRTNEQEEIRPHPDEEWWCATCDSGGCPNEDYDPYELPSGQVYWYGSTIDAAVKVLPQPPPGVTKSTETVGKKKRRDSALGNVLGKVKSIIRRSQ